MYANSFPIANGRWFAEQDVLELLCVTLAENPPLVQWAYEDVGRELEETRVNPRYIPNYLYPTGDNRPAAWRVQTIGLPPVPVIRLLRHS